ncbi:MAG: DNA recombination protein RmuC [Bacteroidia bacterium]|nr:DNA recombination protein RmuC [Bacteroidia bacterium]MDW8415981.1 DNA recombination protein RmuC [Bacteroidia bacterium]
MDTSALIVAFLLGVFSSGLGFWIWLSKTRMQLYQQRTLAQRFENESSQLRSEKRQLEQTLEQLQFDVRRLAEDKARMEGEIRGLHAQINDKNLLLQKSDEDLRLLRKEYDEAISQLSGLREQIELAQKNLEWREAQSKQMETLFENLMQKIVQEGTQFLHARSQESLSSLLLPFREQLEKMQKEMIDYGGKQQENIAKLQGFIDKVLQDSYKLSEQTENLTRALRGNIQVQGRWGEERLRELMELAGFKEGEQFRMQVSIQGADKEQLRPDLVFKLPDNRYILIDAKVSLTAYDRYFSAKTPEEQRKAQEDHANSVISHVRGLAKYQKARIPHIGWTILFCPVEGALQLALQTRTDLLEEARKARVILVGPFVLTGFISIIDQLWQIEKRNRYAEDIAKLAEKMLDKLRRFIEELEKVGKSLEKAKESYDAARGYLISGKENVIATANKLISRGVRVEKTLPPPMVEEALAEEQRAELLLSAHDPSSEFPSEVDVE